MPHLPLFVLGLLACRPNPSDPKTSQDTEDTSAPTLGTAEAKNNRDFEPAAREMIQGATQRIHVLEYTIYDYGPISDVLDDLVAAAARGVEVRFMADEEAKDTLEGLARLSAGGVVTQLDSPNTTTHNKLIIADDRVLVGSTNFSSSAFDYNNEGDVLVDDPAVAGWYESYFQTRWANPDPYVSLPWDGAGAIVPVADHDTFDHLLACLSGAQTSVHVVMYAMSYYPEYPDGLSTQLLNALVAAGDRGAEVHVIMDASDYIRETGINDGAIARLVDAGIDVRLTAETVTTHAKILVCDDTVIVGDCNWSNSALDEYHGTSVQVTDADLAGDYRDYYESLAATSHLPGEPTIDDEGRSDVSECTDSLDNDGDGYLDCDDYSCIYNMDFDACGREGGSEASCIDQQDEDGDSYVDCQDYDCDWSLACGGSGVLEADDVTCSDGVDNDGDGSTDCDDHACRYTGSVTICE